VKANPIQTNFTAGEVSPYLRGRVDTSKYANGCEVLKNLIVRPQGPLRRRPGTEYVIAAKQTATKARLISLNNTYVIEFGVNYLRIYDRKYASIKSGSTVELVTTYGESDLPKISWESVGNVMYIACKGFHPKKLWNLAKSVGGVPSDVDATQGWVFEDVPFKDGPYMPLLPYNIRMALTNVSDTATMTSSLATQFNPAADVGKYVEFFQDGEWRLAKITAIPGGVATNTCTVDIVDNVFIGVDPVIGLSTKVAGTPRTPTSGTSIATTVVLALQRHLAGSYRIPTGFGTADKMTPYSTSQGLDPATPLTIGAGATGDITSTFVGVLTTTHGQVFTRADVGKFIRKAVNDWKLMVTFKNDANMAYDNTGIVFLAVAAPDTVAVTPGTRVITATCTSSTGFVPGLAYPGTEIFHPNDIGRHIRFNFGGQQIWGKITARTSNTVATITFYDSLPLGPQDARELPNKGVTDIWRYGSWSGRTGYPQAVTIHEQRTVWASTPAEPQSFWMSRSLDFETMSPTEPDSSVPDDCGISYLIASSSPQEICWMRSGTVLMVGTKTGEWQVRSASSVQEPISPTNIIAQPQTTGGSAVCWSVRAGSAILHIDKTGRKVLELTYSFEQDSWISRDLTIVSEHIIRDHGGAIDIVYQQEPNSVVWVLCADGTLCALTYVRDQEVAGWHWHTFVDNDGVAPVVESICAIESTDEDEDTLFMVVQRTINGSVVRYVEALAAEDYPTDAADRSGFNYMDCHKIFAGPGGATLSGLAHLNGETVQIMKNGVFISTGVVAGGNVTVGGQDFTGTICVGLPFKWHLKFLPPEGGSPFGSAQGKRKTIVKADVRLDETIEFRHGLTEALASGGHLMKPDEGTLFTGDYEVNVEGQWESHMGYYLYGDTPYPFTLVAHMPHLHTNQ
jgi:hypothetical protein